MQYKAWISPAPKIMPHMKCLIIMSILSHVMPQDPIFLETDLHLCVKSTALPFIIKLIPSMFGGILKSKKCQPSFK